MTSNVRKKCCGKCAFRNGSPERCLPDMAENLMMEIAYMEKDFYCHETIEGHFQAEDGEVSDGPKMCAGYTAHKKNGFKKMFSIFKQSPDQIDVERFGETLEKFINETSSN